MIYSHCLWTAQWASCNEQSKISSRTLSDAHKCWYSSLWVRLSVFEHFLVKYQGMDKYHDHHSLVWHNLRTLWTCDWPQKNLLIGWLAFAKLPNSISLRLESNGRPIWYSVKKNWATLHFIVNFDTRQQWRVFTDRYLRPPPPCQLHRESSGGRWKTAPTCGQIMQVQVFKGAVHPKINEYVIDNWIFSSPIQCFFEAFPLNIKLEDGPLAVRGGVVTSSVFFQESIKAIFVRILLTAHEDHWKNNNVNIKQIKR